MNVEASESLSEAWAALEGRLINGAFPLRRYLGGSDHSVVFLTEVAGREPSEAALKLVPVTPALADSQFSRWLTATALDHPHLLRLLDSGRCQIEGQHYLYAVMEYADQNLAQLLENRALTEDEAREMLVPALNALAFLHGRDLVQGRLKPSNILVVGDRLTLASDTIRPVGEARVNINTLSAYDSPEARDGSWSGASDIWALGVTLCEALTRRQPSGLRDGGDGVALPPELSPAFSELIARCVSSRPVDRLIVAELEAWMRGETVLRAPAPAPVTAAALQPAETIALLEPTIPQPAAAQTATTVQPVSASADTQSGATVPPVTASVDAQTAAAVPPVSRSTAVQSAVPVSAASSIATRPPATVGGASESIASQGGSAGQTSKRHALSLTLVAVIVVVLGWVGMRALRTNQAPAPAAANALTSSATEAGQDGSSQSPVAPRTSDTSSTASPPKPSNAAPVVLSAPPSSSKAAADAGASLAEVHKEIPDVPRRASQTIRGHIRVSVRVIVNPNGTVFAALTDQRGPSRYFERLAIEAAKKWTFSPTEAEGQRIVVLWFDFTRQGTTARVATAR